MYNETRELFHAFKNEEKLVPSDNLRKQFYEAFRRRKAISRY